MNIDYPITHDPVEILAGTSNTTSPLYMEAAKLLGGDDNKSLGYLKNFVTSVEKAATQAGSDSRISATRGTLTKFSKYKDVKDGLKLLRENFGGLDFVKNLQSIHDSVIANEPQYSDGYEKHIRLIILEYEAAVYLLVTGISFAIASYVDVKLTGTKIVIAKKSGADKGIIVKTARDMASKLKDKGHKEYLTTLITAKDAKPLRDGEPVKIKEDEPSKKSDTSKKDESDEEKELKESVLITEAAIGDTIELWTSIAYGIGKVAGITKRIFMNVKKTAFGIIPLIRSILYLKYKKKADTVLSLEQQMVFIRMNIEQLQNIKGMDEAKKKEVIKKQEATIEAYRKKAEKLRAELSDSEREVSTAAKTDDAEVKKAPANDDFVLD